MNFRPSEINKWYKTKSGDINSKLVINAINKVFDASSDKKIIYFGPNSIIKNIMNDNYSFNSFFISYSDNADIKAEIQKLPLQNSSIDFVILIHSLDMDKNPHAAFREIDRVLEDDGKIIIVGFNRLSFLGIYSFMPFNSMFRNKNYLSISRLSDWMSLFSYEVKQIFNINKIPPLKNKNIIKYLAFLNNTVFSKINYFGNSYVFFANKKKYKFITVKNWHKKDNIILGKFSKPIIQNNYEE
jgi:SAM-dependent methyltransferase